MKRIATFVAACAVVLVQAPAADAGLPIPAAQLAVTPNPATTADAITIGNETGDTNTCEKGEVFYAVVKVGAEGEGAVAAGTLTPDDNGEGDWSVTIDPIPVAGDFTVSADCTSLDEDQALDVPSRVADFEYDDVVLTVTQADTSSSTATAAPSTSSAAAAATRPTFTG